jgi:hypothetical protein
MENNFGAVMFEVIVFVAVAVAIHSGAAMAVVEWLMSIKY